MRDLHNLDLMRSLAVILVLVDHTALTLGHPYLGPVYVAQVGLVGVFFFFVHTSLVLMWSLQRKPHVLNFYVRRIFRIYPLAMAAIAAALIFRIPVDSIGPVYPPFTHFSWRAILSNLLLVQDLAGSRNIVGVLWSLSCEVAMYVVLPAIFFFAVRERRIWQILVLWLLAALWANKTLLPAGNIFPTVIPLFLPGTVAFLGFGKFSPRLPAALFPVFLVALLGLYLIHPGMRLGWLIALAVGFALPFFRQITQPAAVRATQLIARYSYGIYIWHTFGLRLSFHLLAGQPIPVRLLAMLLFTAAVSVATYHLLEEPCIRLGNRAAQAEDPNTPVPAVS